MPLRQSLGLLETTTEVELVGLRPPTDRGMFGASVQCGVPGKLFFMGICPLVLEF